AGGKWTEAGETGERQGAAHAAHRRQQPEPPPAVVGPELFADHDGSEQDFPPEETARDQLESGECQPALRERRREITEGAARDGNDEESATSPAVRGDRQPQGKERPEAQQGERRPQLAL